jgi:hypothetical protein
MKWREHVWSRGKYADRVTPADSVCRRCGVAYNDLMAQRFHGLEWHCRFRFRLSALRGDREAGCLDLRCESVE